jgi:hypothetical protein
VVTIGGATWVDFESEYTFLNAIYLKEFLSIPENGVAVYGKR